MTLFSLSLGAHGAARSHMQLDRVGIYMVDTLLALSALQCLNVLSSVPLRLAPYQLVVVAFSACFVWSGRGCTLEPCRRLLWSGAEKPYIRF